MPLEVVCILLLQSEYGGPTIISCEVTQTILSLRDNTVCSRHTLQTVQRTQCASWSTLLEYLKKKQCDRKQNAYHSYSGGDIRAFSSKSCRHTDMLKLLNGLLQQFRLL